MAGLPVIPIDPKASDDIDLRDASDHSYDSLRYGVMSRMEDKLDKLAEAAVEMARMQERLLTVFKRLEHFPASSLNAGVFYFYGLRSLRQFLPDLEILVSRKCYSFGRNGQLCNIINRKFPCRNLRM